MAWFTAKEWKNRLVEFAGRRSLKNVSTNETTVYDVTRNEGQVSQEGDSFSATTMNDLEQRISDAFAEAEEANTQLISDLYRSIENSASMSLVDAVTYVCANSVDASGSGRGRFQCAEGVYGYDIVKSSGGHCTGIITSEAESEAYSFYRRAGADAVLKKLGNATFSMTWYHNAHANVVAGLYSSIDLPGNYDTLQVTPKTVSPSNTTIAFKVNGETKQTITSAGATIDLSQYNADIIKLEIFDPYNGRVEVVADIELM